MSNFQNNLITSTEAYAAMYEFLDRFNTTYKSDDVAILLSGLSIASDGQPMDQGYLQEWNECLEKSKKGEIDIQAIFLD